MGKLALVKPEFIKVAQKGLVTGKNILIKQSPIILAGTAMVGVVTTGILAAKAGIVARDILVEETEAKRQVFGPEAELTLVEKVEAVWKPCAPAVISGGLTIGAMVASTVISKKRQAALAGLYALSESALKEYQDKIEEKYGPKEAQKILDDINSDRVNSADDPPWYGDGAPEGSQLCYDKLTGRFFWSSVERLRRAEAELNSSMFGGDTCASLNELYSLINNEYLTPCELGEEVGWNITSPCKLYFTSGLRSDMKTYLVMDFARGHEPSYRYRDI